MAAASKAVVRYASERRTACFRTFEIMPVVAAPERSSHGRAHPRRREDPLGPSYA